jgi:hypothetical protein
VNWKEENVRYIEQVELEERREERHIVENIIKCNDLK